VRAEQVSGGLVDNQLDETARIARSQSPWHLRHGQHAHLYLVALLPCLGFTKSGASYLGIGKRDARDNAGIVDAPGAKQSIFGCQRPAIGGNLDKHIPAQNVPGGINVGVVCLQPVVHQNLAMPSQANAGLFQPHVGCVGPSPGGDQQLLGVEDLLLAIVPAGKIITPACFSTRCVSNPVTMCNPSASR
jgi:hypothetical protein